MSYSKDIKTELCGMEIAKPCCKRALLYGMLLFCTLFSRDKIKYITECRASAELFLHLLDALYTIKGNLYEAQKKGRDPESIEEEEAENFRSSYKITVPQKKQIDKMAELFENGSLSPYRIRKELLLCEHCRELFVRGAFLASGTVSNPKLSYHLELSTPYRNLSCDMQNLLSELYLSPKIAVRKNSYVIYYKESEKIEDFLTVVGASKAAFQLMNYKILKDLRNNTNRVVNCETANIGKSVQAARVVAEAVDRLMSSGKFEALPEDLKQAALLRVEYQELSLKELGEMMTPKLTKSGVNHRLKKIIEYSK